MRTCVCGLECVCVSLSEQNRVCVCVRVHTPQSKDKVAAAITGVMMDFVALWESQRGLQC